MTVRLTPTMRTVLTDIAEGRLVKPTGPRKTALEQLKAERLYRTEWTDDNKPVRVITAKGRAALAEAKP